MMKNYIFDFDGTLADVMEPGLDIINQLASRFHYPVIKNIQDIRKLSLKKILKKFTISPFKLLLITTAVKRELKKRINEVKLFSGMDTVLVSLKKQKKTLAIVSSNAPTNISSVLSRYELVASFDHILTSPFLFQKERLLRRLLKQECLNPKETVYIGDEVRDIEAARKAGIAAVSVCWGLESEEVLKKGKPDFMIQKPSELLKL